MKARREEIQLAYLEKAQELWSSDVEAKKKDSATRKAYNSYRNEDRHLERIQQMFESVSDDLKWYEENYMK